MPKTVGSFFQKFNPRAFSMHIGSARSGSSFGKNGGAINRENGLQFIPLLGNLRSKNSKKVLASERPRSDLRWSFSDSKYDVNETITSVLEGMFEVQEPGKFGSRICVREKQDQRSENSLLLDRLTSIPFEVRRQVGDLGKKHSGQSWLSEKILSESKVVAQLWETLQENTNGILDQFEFVCNPDQDDPKKRDTNTLEITQIALMRFRNIKLVKTSAICDPVRTESGSTPHYLHANLVDFGHGMQFIASQKPLKPEIPGFSEILLQRNVGIVVDLTRAGEQEKDACYAPRLGKSRSADGRESVVTCERSNRVEGLDAHLKHLRIQDGDAQCVVPRLHFKGWPDHGVISEQELIKLADHVESLSPDPARPIVIHCMAGVGRTGTLMSFMAARKRISDRIHENGGKCTIGTVLLELMKVVSIGRLARGPNFVQNYAQFKLVFEALKKNFTDCGPRPFKPTPEFAPDPCPHGRARPSESVRKSALKSPNRPLISDSRSVWDRLLRRHSEIQPGHILPISEVGSNVPGVGCPARTAVHVHTGRGSNVSNTQMHANVITFPLKKSEGDYAGPSRNNHIAVAGQSPQEFAACEKFLLHGLDSRKGLFQFVSTSAHHRPEHSMERSIIGQLRQRWHTANQMSEALVIGGRYKVISLENMNADAEDCHQLRVHAEDIDHPGKTINVLLTQAGLKFEDNRLRVAEIERANTILASHVAAGESNSPDSTADPMIVSYTGIGRNATLICYREALSRLDGVHTVEELDRMLEQVVMQGRQDRGPGFIHSEAQLDELRTAILIEFRKRRDIEAAASMAGLGADSASLLAASKLHKKVRFEEQAALEQIY